MEQTAQQAPAEEKLSANVQNVLRKAARDPAFLQVLIINRETSLSGFTLTAEEKQRLLQATGEELRKMVAQVPSTSGKKVDGRIVMAVAMTITAIVAIWVGPRMIIPRDDPAYEATVRDSLRLIALAQQRYQRKHGTYGTLEQLTAPPEKFLNTDLMPGPQFPYEFLVVNADKSGFRALARLRERPASGWEVDAAGEVRPVGK